MSKNEQMVETFTKTLSKLRQEKREFNESIDARIAAMELVYETFTGQKAPNDEGKPTTRPRTRKVQQTKQGRRIDRQGGEKTLAFIRERGDKVTTVKMIARKFSISPEAASQRLLKLTQDGAIVRVDKGEYLDKGQVNTQATP